MNEWSARAAQAQVAATSFLALLAIVGIALYGLPFFYDFMVRDFGWSRAQVTSGNALSKLLVGPLFGFLAGWMVDRFGPRRLMVAGILMAGIALVGLGMIETLAGFYLFYLFNALGYVCGAAPDKDIAAARRMVADGIAELIPYAQDRGVRLGIEPLHPAFAAERSCITTLREARCLAERFDAATVGVVADVYHIWWDPDLEDEIARAAGRLAGFHVSDWLVPAENVLMNRGIMGDGVIDVHGIRASVEEAGYARPIEVEIFNETVWSMPLDMLLPLLKARYLECV